MHRAPCSVQRAGRWRCSSRVCTYVYAGDAHRARLDTLRTTLAYDRQQLQEEGEPGAEVETEEAVADEELPGGVSDEGERGEGLGR